MLRVSWEAAEILVQLSGARLPRGAVWLLAQPSHQGHSICWSPGLTALNTPAGADTADSHSNTDIDAQKR